MDPISHIPNIGLPAEDSAVVIHDEDDLGPAPATGPVDKDLIDQGPDAGNKAPAVDVKLTEDEPAVIDLTGAAGIASDPNDVMVIDGDDSKDYKAPTKKFQSVDAFTLLLTGKPEDVKMSAKPNWESLPTDPFIQIVSYLDDFKDIVRCSQVCRRYNEICSEESLWKRLSFDYWHLDSCLLGLTWKETFCDQYASFGRYKNYKKLKMAWQNLRQYLEINCPTIAETIQEGATEDLLDQVEQKRGCTLPDDLRCFYRVANGQKLPNLGCTGSTALFGSTNFNLPLELLTTTSCRDQYLLDCEHALEAARMEQTNSVALTTCDYGMDSQYFEWKSGQTSGKGRVLLMVRYDMDTEEGDMDCYIIEKNNLLSWFIDQVDLVTKEYPIIDCIPYKFVHDKESVAMTGPIKVSVATCFVPSLSVIGRPEFVHMCRITMSMDEAASEDWSCQFQSQNIYTGFPDEDESVQVDFPIIRPGVSHSWSDYLQCTSKDTTGTGYFVMSNLKSGNTFKVECPTFPLKSLPFINRLCGVCDENYDEDYDYDTDDDTDDETDDDTDDETND